MGVSYLFVVQGIYGPYFQHPKNINNSPIVISRVNSEGTIVFSAPELVSEFYHDGGGGGVGGPAAAAASAVEAVDDDWR
jgi:hypothetical protein